MSEAPRPPSLSLHHVPAGPAVAPLWQVRLLGAVQLGNGRDPPLPWRRSALALLARLAMAPGRDHPREELAALLWPDADAGAGRARLRQSLLLLKAQLEPTGAPPVLEADRRVLRVLPGALWCDAAAFEQACLTGQHTLARALYAGPLMPGFDDEWVVDERARLADLLGALGLAGVRGAALPPMPPSSAAAPVPASVPMPAPSTLPQRLTRLFGAEPATQALRALQQQQRLVTLTGAAGVGKTRLALDVAAADFPHAVFVPLVDVQGLRPALRAVRLALRDTAAGPAPLLLLLDGAEALAGNPAPWQAVLRRLQQRHPALRCLITSRRALGVAGEALLRLDPLPLPDHDNTAIHDNPAVALFIDRARAHRADFELHAGNHDAVLALLQWLDGLPLAIELAAAHMRTLGPAELLALLQAAGHEAQARSAALALLARRGGRSAGDHGRHASLLALALSDWRLLTAPQQQLLMATSLLPDGATAAELAALAAAVVSAAPGAAAAQLVAGLQAASLLRTSAGATPGAATEATRQRPWRPLRELALADAGAAAAVQLLLQASTLPADLRARLLLEARRTLALR